MALEMMLDPAGAAYVSTALLRLQAHYWRPEFSPAQARELYVDYIEDLSDLPADILDEAVRQYRRKADAKWFPRTGDLLAIGRPLLEERERARQRLRRHIDYVPEPPEVPRTEAQKARVREMAKSLWKTP